MKFKKILLSAPLFIYSCAIFYMSQQSKVPDIFNELNLSDKILHFMAYFVYGITIMLFLIPNTSLSNTRLILLILAIGYLFGASDELHQYFIPGRSCDFFDWCADAGGVSLSLVLLKILNKNLKKWLFSN